MTPNRLRILPLIIAALALLLWWQNGGTVNEPGVSGTTPSASIERPASSELSDGKGFRNQNRLIEHFAKHGAEFGAASPQEYLSLAQQLRDAPLSSDVLEDIRSSDGVVSRFQKSTGAFLAFDSDGTIRTFFKPNDGERYYRRQLTRRPE